MSLGTSNGYLPVWPPGGGKAGLGTCLCGPAASIFYDVLAIGGGHGGDDASLTRDFALPPKAIFLVGEFAQMRDRRWNDNTGAPAWTTTAVDTARIAKIYLRDTGQGCAHPQVDQKFAQSAGFLDPARRICRNWQPVGTGGSPTPCEVFVYSVLGFPNPPAALRWSVPERVIGGTTYAAEAVSSPAHKLGVGGTDWKGTDDFLPGWTSFRYPGYGTPGSTHACQCTREAFDAGRRGAARELCFVDAFGRTGGGVRFYDADGVFSFAQLSINNVFSFHPRPQVDFWNASGVPTTFGAGVPEATVVEVNGVAIVPAWPGHAGSIEDCTDTFLFPAAANAGPGYVANQIALLRLARTRTWEWNGVASADYTGGILVESTGGTAVGGQTWNQEQGAAGGCHFFDCDADGRLYFGVNVTALAGSPVAGYQLFRVDRLGTNPVQLGTVWKNGVEGYVFGCVVLADPAYGGSGISHALVVGDFDAYSPPTGATSTAMKTGLNGMMILSLRDGQNIAAQTFWPGRFRTGVVTVNTGDWLPGPIVEV